MKDGVLMRMSRRPTVPASQESSLIYQIVIPKKYRNTVLHLAHDTPMAGHLGVSKTDADPSDLGTLLSCDN